MNKIIIKLIQFYQRRISPYKGYGCSLRVQGFSKTGCSGYALKLFKRESFFKAMLLLRRRLDKCALSSLPRNTSYRMRSQAGDCDPGCDPGCACDAPDCNIFDNCSLKTLNLLEYCDCGCDFGERTEQKKQSIIKRVEARNEKRLKRRQINKEN